QFVTPTSTGFVATFNHALNPMSIHLFDPPSVAPNVQLLSAQQGLVRGSLVLDAATGTRLTFVQTSGVLPGDTYTVVLPGNLRDVGGKALDGQLGSPPGTPFTTSFTLGAPPAVVVSVPHFARGPGQTVQLVNGGLPLRISDAADVTAIDVTL